MSASCPACGARVSPDQNQCSTCFADLPWARPGVSAAEAGQQRRRIVISEVSYVGALPGTRPCSSGILELSDERIAVLGGVHMDDSLGTSVPAEFVMPTEGITAAAVEGPEQVERRVTATRIFLVGIFAFAWRKTQKVSYLVLETKEGIAVFECRSHTPLELRARLGSWLAPFRELPNSDSQAVDDPDERLRRLVALHADGLVTDDEFRSKRAEIIAEL